MKATLSYKIFNDKLSPPPHLRDFFLKPNDTSVNYILGNLETDLALPRPKTNFLKSSLTKVVQWSGIIFLMRQKQQLDRFINVLNLY